MNLKNKNRLEKIDNKLKKLSNLLNYLYGELPFFPKNEGFNIISSIASKIEEKKMVVKEKNIIFYYLYNGFIEKEECTMAYLVEEELEDLTELEILAKYPAQKDNSTELEIQNSIQSYKRLSETPSDTYVQLAFYQKEANPSIEYVEVGLSSTLDPFGGIRKDKIRSSIVDERYRYIPALMEEIQKYKLEKYIHPCAVSTTNIDKIIDEYAEEYKRMQKGNNYQKKS